MWENTSFHNSAITHEGRYKYQVTFIFMENQGKSLINNEQMVFDEHALVFNKKDCTIEESIFKLWENTSFHNSAITHEGRNTYQVTFIFMENQGKSLINTEHMIFDEHALVLIKNRLHH